MRMLILTGCRLHEIVNLRWHQVDLDKKLIEIDGKRMMTGNPHTIPLAPMACELLVSLPRPVGPCVFSASGGRSSFVGFYRAKLRLDHACGVTEFTIQ